MKSSFHLIALCLALLTAACAGETAPPPPRPNLLLIVSDTLRADALSCYGGKARTPNICGLAERGVLFENNFANAPWTLPSSTAIFTGNYPSQYQREVKRGKEIDSFFLVPQEERLFTEALKEEGYDAKCLVENKVARRAHATQGFPRQSESEGPEKVSPEVVEKLAFEPLDHRYLHLALVLEYLLGRPPDGAEGSPSSESAQKFFLLHWFNDPHAEYRPPLQRLEEEGWTFEDYPRSREFYLGLGHRDRPKKNLHKLREQLPLLSAEELELVETLYLKEAESVDERVGYLLKALEIGGHVDNTLVIFTSDHGEGFGEHGGYLHGNNFYNELMHVPLIFAGPGIAGGRRITSPVSHVDVVPTLVDLFELEGFEGLQGRSLLDLLTGARDEDPRRVHYLSSPDRLERDALVWEQYKLIAGLEDDHLELYDMVADPGETKNLADELPEVVAKLRGQLERIRQDNERRRQIHLAGDDAGTLAQTEEETRKELEAVGYLDGVPVRRTLSREANGSTVQCPVEIPGSSGSDSHRGGDGGRSFEPNRT